MGRFASRALITLSVFLFGCASVQETAVRSQLVAAQDRGLSGLQGGHADSAGAPLSVDLSRGYPAYAAQALATHPAVQAAFARWQSSVLSISRTRRLPEPTIKFAYFARSVETRVGPQQFRLSLQQSFPWPTKLTAGADAASAAARAEQRRFEARALIVVDGVAQAYWTLWELRQAQRIHEQHLEVIRGLSETIGARVVVGNAELSDRLQVDLRLARLADQIEGLSESIVRAQARLRASVGLPPGTALPTPERPDQLFLSAASPAALAELVSQHPMLEAYVMAAEAEQARSRVASAERLPSFSVGADWIITGQPSDGLTVPADAGKDAVIVGAAVSVPLWQGSYGDSIAAAEAAARAQQAQGVAAKDRALADLDVTLANLRDAARRVQLVKGTLLPQANAVYQSILGSYSSGRGTVAQTMLAQRDLLELRVELEKAWADHRRAWARLEQLAAQALDQKNLASATPEDS